MLEYLMEIILHHIFVALFCNIHTAGTTREDMILESSAGNSIVPERLCAS